MSADIGALLRRLALLESEVRRLLVDVDGMVSGSGSTVVVSGVDLSDLPAADLAETAAAGTSDDASRSDHVHALPTPADIGAATDDHTHEGTGEHDHDDTYYTEAEVDTLLAGKSAVGHLHDDRYYTETETDDLLDDKSDVGHTHAAGDVTSGTFALARLPTAARERELVFTVSGTVAVADLPWEVYNWGSTNRTIVKVGLSVPDVAGKKPVGDNLIVDIKVNGTTVFTTSSNRPEIADGAASGFSSTIDAPAWNTGTKLTGHVVQVGTDPTPGEDLVIHVVYTV